MDAHKEKKNDKNPCVKNCRESGLFYMNRDLLDLVGDLTPGVCKEISLPAKARRFRRVFFSLRNNTKGQVLKKNDTTNKNKNTNNKITNNKNDNNITSSILS